LGQSAKFAALIVGTVLLAIAVSWMGYRQNTAPSPANLAYSEFLQKVESHEIVSAEISGRKVQGELMGGGKYFTDLPEDTATVDRLAAQGVRVSIKPDAAASPGLTFLTVLLLPLLLIGTLSLLFWRSAPMGGEGSALGFGKSRARLIAPDKRRATLADVAGIDEAEAELKEIVDFLKNPQVFQRLGGKMPKGCLLIGPPGTGKTLLARAIAGEANVPFYTISGSDFVEMFVGVGAARVRDMFAQAKANAPCIVFVDELDAVGRRRGTGMAASNDEREQTLNQLLVEMDGFDSSDGIILLAATNRPDILDPALLRPGRFDRQIVLTNPDVIGRQQILKVHLRKVPTAPDVDPLVIARGTPGFSGADLANLVNEAALLAARRGNRLVTMAEFDEAKDKLMMGLERRSLAMSEKEKRTTAYHEAGHALVTFHTPGSDPLHKVTIVPRGRSMGLTMSLPERDRYGFTKKELESKLAVMFGGRAAEELVFGEDNVSTGAADDIRHTTELARRMVTEFGFSERLGPLSYQDSEQETGFMPFGRPPKSMSEETAKLIDGETRKLAEAAKGRARNLLGEHVQQLHMIAKALLANETLSGADIRALLGGAPVIPFEQAARAAPPKGAAPS
jgi:cell division protease FtsH